MYIKNIYIISYDIKWGFSEALRAGAAGLGASRNIGVIAFGDVSVCSKIHYMK